MECGRVAAMGHMTRPHVRRTFPPDAGLERPPEPILRGRAGDADNPGKAPAHWMRECGARGVLSCQEGTR